MNKIDVYFNKTIKLINVLIMDIENLDNVEDLLQQMERYIKLKGGIPKGPLIQYNCLTVDSYGRIESKIKYLRQCENRLLNVVDPYTSKEMIRVCNCIYAHYEGPECCINLAYAKISVIAFEKNIKLKGDSYTVFVDRDDNDNIVADIFMEKEENE